MNSMEKKTEDKKEVPQYNFNEKRLQEIKCGYDGIVHITIEDPNKIIQGVMFTIQGSVSGCGLGIIKGTSMYGYSKYDKEKLYLIGQAIKQYVGKTIAGTMTKGCVLATLGNVTKGVSDQYLLDMGFVKIHTFDNIAHTGNDTQSIYALNIERHAKK